MEKKYPHGRVYDPEISEVRLIISAPGIVRAYDYYQVFNKLLGERTDLLNRIFYLARDIDKDHDLKYAVKDSIRRKIGQIAEEGRTLSLENPAIIEERIRLGKLFSDGSHTFAAQLMDPKRGCSASLCSNCDEPIAFCDTTCKTCSYELIGAHAMPTVEDWERLTPELKTLKMRYGYGHMIGDIACRGDWRGGDSPLNRFKDKKVRWGGYSPYPGGTPLIKITGME